jgi:surfeit locus 1 family protein
VATAILAGLGVWQVERLGWKEALIARVTERLGAPPVAAPGPAAWPSLDAGDLEYRPVTVTGTFLNDREVDVIAALTEPKGKVGGIGYLVMTPLVTDAGWVVYVNRGFVPEAKKLASSRPGSLLSGTTTVTGLFRAPRDRAWFMPGDNTTTNAWFSRDPALYAKTYGVPGAIAPYIIDANFDPALPEGIPQGGETIVTFPNSHLGYAITWFGLALCCVGVFIAFASGRLRGKS